MPTREPKRCAAERCYELMQWLMGRPERSVAVVSHSGFLYTLVNCGVLTHTHGSGDDNDDATAAGGNVCPIQPAAAGGAGQRLTDWFSVSEIRSMVVSFPRQGGQVKGGGAAQQGGEVAGGGAAQQLRPEVDAAGRTAT